MSSSSSRKQNNNKRTNNKKKKQYPSIVGPEYIQILEGNNNIFNDDNDDSITLVLCGESHQDAIDVTRSGGIFDPIEGWIEMNFNNIIKPYLNTNTNKKDTTNNKKNTNTNNTKKDNMDNLMICIHAETGGNKKKKKNKLLTLEKSQEWAKNTIEEELDIYGQISLLWIKENSSSNPKGKAFILSFKENDDEEEDEDKEDEEEGESDDDDDEDEEENWISLQSILDTKNNNESEESLLIPLQVYKWLLLSLEDNDDTSTNIYRSFEWGDLDSEAYELNRRRLLSEDEISNKELDDIIHSRKQKLLQENNIITWDDWLMDTLKKKKGKETTKNDDDDDIDIHLILESQVPPWELSLHRPTYNSNKQQQALLPHAADCIRNVPEDEEEDIEDLYDPANDGIGSYMDYIYRRFMEQNDEQEKEGNNNSNKNKKNNNWIHCVDMRDIGCEGSVQSEFVQKEWMNRLLTPQERDELLVLKSSDKKKAKEEFINIDEKIHSSSSNNNNNTIPFIPESNMNPERKELERLRSIGKLVIDEEDDDEDDNDTTVSFPSFESFFGGQCSDVLYYSKHIRLCYAPFMSYCVQSISNWENFFNELFLGGTIPTALSMLHLNSTNQQQEEDSITTTNNNNQYLYIRSPIRQEWNSETNSYDYHHRDDGENYITNPFFPLFFYLCAADDKENNEEKSNTIITKQQQQQQQQTWSSRLFTKVTTNNNDDNNNDNNEKISQIAQMAKEWILQKIRMNSLDPKNSDDTQSGGEWFEAYLYAEHRDIYDDIDVSDATVLLTKKKMKSLTEDTKHNIGKIQIPSCSDAFQEINQYYNDGLKNNIAPTQRIEVLSEIIIDICMSRLIDFVTILKILEIISMHNNNVKKKKKLMIVCYMGAAHTRAVSEFFTTSPSSSKKKNNTMFRKKSFTGKNDYKEHEMRALKLPDYLW